MPFSFTMTSFYFGGALAGGRGVNYSSTVLSVIAGGRALKVRIFFFLSFAISSR